MGVIAEGILRGCQGLFTPVSLGYPLSVLNKNSTLNKGYQGERNSRVLNGTICTQNSISGVADIHTQHKKVGIGVTFAPIFS